jgi:hypothetical protein
VHIPPWASEEQETKYLSLPNFWKKSKAGKGNAQNSGSKSTFKKYLSHLNTLRRPVKIVLSRLKQYSENIFLLPAEETWRTVRGRMCFKLKSVTELPLEST